MSIPISPKGPAGLCIEHFRPYKALQVMRRTYNYDSMSADLNAYVFQRQDAWWCFGHSEGTKTRPLWRVLPYISCL
jgi:hypothetical protein